MYLPDAVLRRYKMQHEIEWSGDKNLWIGHLSHGRRQRQVPASILRVSRYPGLAYTEKKGVSSIKQVLST